MNFTNNFQHIYFFTIFSKVILFIACSLIKLKHLTPFIDGIWVGHKNVVSFLPPPIEFSLEKNVILIL